MLFDSVDRTRHYLYANPFIIANLSTINLAWPTHFSS
jgi:cytochrome b subunit of formate dehydrogenase